MSLYFYPRFNRPHISKHVEAILFFNNLIIDLKLIQGGAKPEAPITSERLELASKQIQDLEQCEVPDPDFRPWYR